MGAWVGADSSAVSDGVPSSEVAVGCSSSVMVAVGFSSSAVVEVGASVGLAEELSSSSPPPPLEEPAGSAGPTSGCSPESGVVGSPQGSAALDSEFP